MQVYIHEQGSYVRKKGGLLLVTKGKDKLKQLPLKQLEQLVLMGNVQLTTQAAKYFLKNHVDVVFMTTYGKYLGRLDEAESRFANLRRLQARLTDNPQRSLELARQMIVGKVNNQRVVLGRRADEDLTAAQALKGMLGMLHQIETARTPDQLRGVEGKAAAYYFEGIRTFVSPEWGFTKREYYPPPDPMNVLLSFAYTLLLKDVKTAIQIVGLDPAFGFFHVMDDQRPRPSLALDLMEEFRPSVADIVVLTVIMQGHITLHDFERTDDSARPVRLGKDGEEALIQAYESRMADKIFHPLANGETAYRNAVEYQARQMRWIVEGRQADYNTLDLR